MGIFEIVAENWWLTLTQGFIQGGPLPPPPLCLPVLIEREGKLECHCAVDGMDSCAMDYEGEVGHEQHVLPPPPSQTIH